MVRVMALVSFLAFVFCVGGVAIALIFLPLWLDRVIVFVMRTGRIYLFPTAIRLALSLETQEDEWQLDNDKLLHPSIGKVWLVTSRSLQVQLPDTNQSRGQVWRP